MQGWEYITAARLISHKPCRLLSLTCTPSGNTSTLIVYDGENTTAPVMLQVEMKEKLTLPIIFPGGLKTDRGLYIGSFNDITGVLVQWEVD